MLKQNFSDTPLKCGNNKSHKPAYNRSRRLTATRLILAGYVAAVFIGAALLMIPSATKADEGIAFIDALFTSTSALCVTGLAVHNTFETFTVFGQIVILLLIQAGGIGFMTLSSFLYLTLSKHISLNMRAEMREDVADGNVGRIKSIVCRILLLTLGCEIIGAAVLIGAFSEYMSAGNAVWTGIFTSVSAFCNAGFDIIDGSVFGASLTGFYSNPLVLLTVSVLIILGGIGFLTVTDIWEKKTWKRFRLHTKVVLLLTFALILIGTAFYLGVEYDNPDTLGNMSFGDKLLNALFQSITTRTAGFNAIEQSSMRPASKLFTDFLMFIGASPGSTGGGIKTTTLFIGLATVYSVVKRKKYAVIDRQSIGSDAIHKAAAVLTLALVIFAVSVTGLLLTDGNSFTFEEIAFEQISAYATVGLSLGITSGLSVCGKLIIIVNMFLGRVGTLTFFIAFTKSRTASEGKIVYPECSIDI